MSRVFLAEETALGRKVVIKVLPPDMAVSVNQDRFRREMQVVARLQHPHVVPLLNAGLAGELLWYSMPFVEGESLRARVARSGELPIAEAARLLREVAEALEHAHTHGVVHRDIKPDNVLLSDGHAVVTDFGVAKAVTESGGAGGLTSVGFALGTPLYMAPEQATADPQTDERADIYALGAMGYEMLTGQPPFTGPNPQAVLAGHLTRTASAVSSVRPAVPATLNAIIMRCLEKRPADRFQRARELIPHLDAYLTPSGGTMATPVAAVEAVGTVGTAHPVRVGAYFAVGSLLVLAAAYWLVQRLGLPTWVLLAAIALLLIGLPIVLWASMQERQRAIARVTGEHPVVPSGPLGQLTTLKGALRGGAFAFAGLLVGAAAFMALRAAGVGPFATLVSAGVLSTRDKMVLADFENRTSDSTMGQTVTAALRIDLMRSTVGRLLEPADVSGSLQRMERDPATPVTAAVAQEVATREGAKAVIVGDIASLGGGYVLSARVVSAADGSTLLAERESANQPSELIAAVDRLSRKVREGIGESLKSIRAGEPLEVVTTPSIEALRKYSQAERLSDRDKYDEALALIDETIRLDSNFAMAWRKRGVILGNTQRDPAGEVSAVQKAYDLRDRLPERERLIATAYYHNIVDRDRRATIAAYQDLLSKWPDDPTALNNIAISLAEEGRFSEAAAAARHGTEVSRETGVLWFNLVEAEALQGNFAAADSAYHQWAIVSPGSGQRLSVGGRLGWAKRDLDMVVTYADSAAQSGQLSSQARGKGLRASVARARGQVNDARRLLREVQVLDLKRSGTPYFTAAIYAAMETVIGGGPEMAVRYLDSVTTVPPLTSLTPLNRNYPRLAAEYARAGALARAEGLMRDYEREVPEVLRQVPERWVAEGMIAQGKGEHARAIEALRRSQVEEGCRVCRLFEIGQSFDAMKQPDSVLAIYEAFTTLTDPAPLGRDIGFAWSYKRMGEIWESKGDTRKALENYGKFVDLWKDADASLQPRVVEVRKRIAELSARER